MHGETLKFITISVDAIFFKTILIFMLCNLTQLPLYSRF